MPGLWELWVGGSEAAGAGSASLKLLLQAMRPIHSPRPDEEYGPGGMTNAS